MKKKRRLTIGYLSKQNYVGIAMDMLNGAIQAVQDHDLNFINVITGTTLIAKDFGWIDSTTVQMINPEIFDALITWPTLLGYSMNEDEIIAFHQRFKDRPIISIATRLPGASVIISDDKGGITQIMHHLYHEHGFRRIAFIGGKPNHLPSRQRFEAYCDFLKKNRLEYRPELVVETTDFSSENGRNAVREFFITRGLTPKKEIEAIVSVSDVFAYAAIRELEQMGIKVPGDVALTGFNNRPESTSLSPSITTIDIKYYEYGRHAVTEALRLIKTGNKAPREIVMPARLILRESCGCLEKEVRNAILSGSHSVAASLTRESLPRQRDKTTEALQDYIKRSFNDADFQFGQLEQVLDAFFEQLLNESVPALFPYMLRSYLFLLKDKEQINAFQDVISEFRRLLLPHLSEPGQLTRAESLLHQARVVISKTVGTTVPQTDDEPNLNFARNASLIQSSMSIETFTELMQTELPKLNIPSCYMALYEDMEHPVNSDARLILAIRDKKPVDPDLSSVIFPAGELLPEKLWPSDRPFLWQVNTCFDKDRLLGYIIFEMGPHQGAIYQILRFVLSSMLHRILVLEDREHLLETLQQMNSHLQEAIQEANNANQAKSRFLANISHEIRTPLNAIVGFAEIIKSAKDSQDKNAYISFIIEESEKLMELINQLLDISKIEAGKLQLSRESFDLHHLIEYITSTYAAMAHTKKLEYQCAIAADVPQFVYGDALRLRQILINLIGNAIKFTEKGRVAVSVAIATMSSRDVKLLFRITDTGVGIPADKQAEIFDTFVQAEDTTTKKFGGTGLGTAISRELVHLMGGEIGVESRLGEGSTFWFTVNLDKSAAQRAAPDNPAVETEATPQLENVSILLVEDYPTNRAVAKVYLEHLGCRVVIAENGLQAVAKFQEGPVANSPVELSSPFWP
jgi:signal transduction histidine kinase/DNA-binding LacI/PurR family transcriptional regulator